MDALIFINSHRDLDNDVFLIYSSIPRTALNAFGSNSLILILDMINYFKIFLCNSMNKVILLFSGGLSKKGNKLIREKSTADNSIRHLLL